MGPLSRYLGPWVPEPQLWQDPVPEVDHELIADEDIAALKGKILESGLSISQLVSTAWSPPPGLHRLGFGGELPRHRHARRGQRGADGFRNYLRAGEKLSPETLLLDRAFMLTLTAPEMTVLIGDMRALNANVGRAPHGVFTDRPETLTNDFFVNLFDMGTEWKASARPEIVRVVWVAQRVIPVCPIE